jgi:hypothetical protein
VPWSGWESPRRRRGFTRRNLTRGRAIVTVHAGQRSKGAPRDPRSSRRQKYPERAERSAASRRVWCESSHTWNPESQHVWSSS